MGQPARLPYYTYDEYRRFERDSNVKHEYLDGQILAMVAGTPAHAGLAAVMIEHLGATLARAGCHTYTSDVRVRVSMTGLATYPT